MEKKSQKPYLIDYSLLIAQDFWRAYYQILLIILLKEFIKLNANMGVMIKRLTINTIELKDKDFDVIYVKHELN